MGYMYGAWNDTWQLMMRTSVRYGEEGAPPKTGMFQLGLHPGFDIDFVSVRITRVVIETKLALGHSISYVFGFFFELCTIKQGRV